jgi:hypothetical protein
MTARSVAGRVRGLITLAASGVLCRRRAGVDTGVGKR